MGFLNCCSPSCLLAALLQQKANSLTIWDGLTQKELDELTETYTEVFQSTQYIVPYPQRPAYQFQYQWWIIEMQFFIFALTAGLTLFPSAIERARPVALTFLAAAFVLVMDNVNAVFYLLRNDTAKYVFDAYRIETAQAGLIMVGCGNCLTIIFMGLYQVRSNSCVCTRHCRDLGRVNFCSCILLPYLAIVHPSSFLPPPAAPFLGQQLAERGGLCCH
jgi:hypothetical protein